ncbi:uncharacterized protein METZ01_LOCUS272567, partial [marine metagenome]
VATLRNHAARIGLGLAGLFLGVHPAMAQPTDPNSAETLANRLGQAIDWVKKADNQGEPGAAEKVTAITKIMKSGKK